MFAETPVPHRVTKPLTGAEWAALAGILALAAGLRLYQLGTLGLQVDEGIQALAVEGWIQNGVPVVPSGAVYQRSIPFLALQAIAARVTALNEFAIRLPAALFGVGCVAAAYGLARGMFDRRIAFIVATFIALSSWEIELSRYARFYTAFQASFVVAFLCLYRLQTGGARVWRFGFVAATLAAITLHDLSIAIAPLFLIPLFDRDATPKFRAKSMAGGALFVVVWLVYRRVAGPWLVLMAPPSALEPVLSPEVIESGARVFPFLPGILMPDLSSVAAALTDPASGFHLVLLVMSVAWYLVWRRSTHLEGLLLASAAVFGVLHLFMLSMLLLLAWFLWFAETWKDLWGPRMRPILLSLAVSLGFWGVVLMRGAAGKEELRDVILTLFGFPNVLQHFLYWFALGWPLFLLGTMIACAAMLRRYVTTREKALLYLPGGILIPVIIASFFSAYQESRYVFHIYPLLVVAFAWGIVRLADRLGSWTVGGMGPGATLAGIAAIAFLLTGDVGPSTLAPLTRTYGDARDVMRSVISWPAYGRFHQDQVGAALHVREHMRVGDRVVAIGLPHQLHVYRFYTGRLDAAVTRTGNASYQRLLEGRLIDRYTGAALVSDVDDLLQGDGATTWFIGDTVLASEDVLYFPAEVRSDVRRVAADAEFRGRDGRTFVVKVP